MADPSIATATGRRKSSSTAVQQQPKQKEQERQEETNDCDACKNSSRKRTLKSAREETTWIGCEACGGWNHSVCVGLDPEAIATIDKWYCATCVSNASTPLETTYRVAPRKSSRENRVELDYSNLNQHLNSDPERWQKVIATKVVIEGAFKSMKAEELTEEWLYSDAGMVEPFVIIDPLGLGMLMPSKEITIQDICRIVGGSAPIEVIDVSSQSSLSNWTLNQWAKYYNDKKPDKKIRNVISLEVSNSPLSSQVQAPDMVHRGLDWVEKHWPEGKHESRPRVQKYCLMSVAKCHTSWHIDFHGSSVFYHIVRGSKVFYFISPTKSNLEQYELWSGSSDMQNSVWLGDLCDAVYKVTLQAGNTMIIPTGWIHCVHTPVDSLVFGGNFLHSLDIAAQLDVYNIELRTKIPKKYRFPESVKLHWYVARDYLDRLRDVPPPSTLPVDLSPRILRGLKVLSTFLIDQCARFAKNAPVSAERRKVSKENVPDDLGMDPGELSRELRARVLTALGERRDELCDPPPPFLSATNKRKSEVGSQTASPAPALRAGNTVKAIKAEAGRDDAGEIISRVVTPVTRQIKRMNRVDPIEIQLGARPAEVTEATSSTSVVRRSLEDGVVVIETRTVLTKVERVRFVPSSLLPSASLPTLPSLQSLPSSQPFGPVLTPPAFTDHNLLDQIQATLPPSLSSPYTASLNGHH